MNIKELICLILIWFYIHHTKQLESFLEGPCPYSLRKADKRDNSAFCMQQCTLNTPLLKYFCWTWKQSYIRTNRVILPKYSWYATPTNLYLNLNSTLPTIQHSYKQWNETQTHFSVGSYNKITSDSGSLDYPLLNSDPLWTVK